MSRDYILQPYRAALDLRIDYEVELNDAQRAAVVVLSLVLRSEGFVVA